MRFMIAMLLTYAWVYGVLTYTMARNHPPGEVTERYCK